MTIRKNTYWKLAYLLFLVLVIASAVAYLMLHKSHPSAWWTLAPVASLVIGAMFRQQTVKRNIDLSLKSSQTSPERS